MDLKEGGRAQFLGRDVEDTVRDQEAVTFSLVTQRPHMGRYRRKQPKRGPPTHVWSWKERNQLIEYLQTYRSLSLKRGSRNDRQLTISVVGLVFLPPLDSEATFREPYLLFPSSLTPKQRKIAHEVAAECTLRRRGARQHGVEKRHFCTHSLFIFFLS